MNRLRAMRLWMFLAGAAVLAGGCGAETDSKEPTASSSSALIAGSPLEPPAPIVHIVEPKEGHATGGDAVTVVGENFSTVPGATTFFFGGSLTTNVTCPTSNGCTLTTPASETPDLTSTVDIQARVGGKLSDPNPLQDTYKYNGTGPVCTGVFTCSGTFGTVTDAFFQCDRAEGTLQLFRSDASGNETLTNATVFDASPQETDIFELGFMPSAATTGYRLCVTSTFSGQRNCGRFIELDTSQACVCTPKTCASLSDTCGSVSDGCGGTLNCGFCLRGNSCSSNHCCPTGTTWSGWQSACVTPTTCTTPACQCQAQGGTWTGKFCT
jgi:hypothetical protein